MQTTRDLIRNESVEVCQVDSVARGLVYFNSHNLYHTDLSTKRIFYEMIPLGGVAAPKNFFLELI